MKLKLTIEHYFVFYFFLMMALYHYKVKTYFYWSNIALLLEDTFGFSLMRFIIAIMIFLVDIYLLKTINKTKFVFIVISIFFIILTVPSLVAFTSGSIYPIKLLLYHQALFIGLLLFSKIKVDFSKVPVINKRQALYLLLALTTIGVIPYLLIYGPHINLKNLFLVDVYKTRRIMGAFSNPYFGYTYSIFTKIIIPLIIVFALELNKKVWVVVGVLYLILFYLFGAHKTVYAGLLVVLIFYRFSFAQSVKYMVKYSSILIVLFIILAAIGYDYPWILSFRRIHFLPTLLDISYLDYFVGKPLIWSESVFKSFIDYPYDLRHTNLIGQEYFNNAKVSANNGLISDGFMNFGSLGVLVNIFLVSVYFMALNSLKIPSRYFGLFVLGIFAFISSSTFTVFLTHGAFALLLVSIFLLNDKKQNKSTI